MTAQFFSGTLDDLVKKYKALTIEKHVLAMRELESRIQMLEMLNGAPQHIKECQIELERIKKDHQNFTTTSDELFKQVVLNRDLLLNVVVSFDKGKIEEREAHILSLSKINQIAEERARRKGKYRKMDEYGLLTAAMNNEITEIEILKIKIAQNEQVLGISSLGE